MASSKYDFANRAMGFGFYSIYDKGKIEYIGITEGFTQLITANSRKEYLRCRLL